MIITIVLLSIIVIIALVIWGFDFYHYGSTCLSRYHIGQWADVNLWKHAVINKAEQWTIKTPTVQISDNTRYLLIDMIRGKYQSQSIQSWQKAALLLGLKEFSPETCISETATMLTSDGDWKKPPVSVDSAMLAYAILKTAPDTNHIKPAMDHLVNVIFQNKDDQGLISYCGGPENKERYVDLIGLACPFLAAYASVYDEPAFASLAFKQICFFHDYGILQGSSLPCHAIHRDTYEPLGVFGWGRGTVWYTLGLIDTWLELPDGKEKDLLSIWIKEAADSYLRYQREDGGFGSILQRRQTYDSSATAGLAYFFSVCADVFHEKRYAACAEKCQFKLMKATRRDGAIDWCQGDTKDIGVFSHNYAIMPFAQGLTIRSFR